jgi:hypothetical protein
MAVVSVVAGDQDSKSKECTGGDFGAPIVHTSSRTRTQHRGTRTLKKPSIAIRPIGPQVAANCLDQRSASPQFKQPSSTSTVSLSTVRRGGLSTSTERLQSRWKVANERVVQSKD